VEFLLNICWLIIALGASCFWIGGLPARVRGRSHGVAVEAVALSCVLVLLLFPISMTDDLHPEVSLSAGIVCDRRGSPQLCPAPPVAHSSIGGSAPFIAVARPSFRLTQFLSVAPLYELAFSDAIVSGSLRDRAPPALHA